MSLRKLRFRLSGKSEQGRQLAKMKWGLVPAWSPEPKVKYSTLNARSEEAATKSTYRSAMKSRHCLIPADGFYEFEEITRRSIRTTSNCGINPFLPSRVSGNCGTKVIRRSNRVRF